MKRLNILFASSEVTPFAKTGGLADVSASLPEAMASLDHQVRVVMPLYRSVKEGNFNLKEAGVIKIPSGEGGLQDKVFFLEEKPNLLIYFIKNDKFFDRSSLYGTSEGDYPDNADRFIFFSRGVLHLAQMIDFQPDLIHCNDWQTGLVPVYLRTVHKDDPFFRETKILFTIHNLAYQGLFPPKDYLAASGLPPGVFSVEGLEYYGQMNFMKGGIVFSDIITTVSEKYAEEIRTPEYSYGLDGVLQSRSSDVYGVLNGVDYGAWSPETDPHIAANYSQGNLSGKRKCKDDLRNIFDLTGGQNVPIIGMISRLADQKGFDLLFKAVGELLKMDLALVLLGTGDKKYEDLFAELGKKHKGRFGVKVAFDNVLAHKIEAGSDMFLMPSRYEPCGLNQMYSLKYGTIPVVRATGGLDDTIKDFNPETGEGNGFKFVEYSSLALVEKIKKALAIFQNKKLWENLVKNAMKEDFSWKKSALRYEEIYRIAQARRTITNVKNDVII